MDRYFVVSPDGGQYGPVDPPGPLQWVREGRVLTATQIRKNGAGPVRDCLSAAGRSNSGVRASSRSSRFRARGV